VVDIALPGWGDGGGGALALPVKQRGAQGQVAVAGGGGEEGFDLVEGHKQQVGLEGFVPEDAFAVDPGGIVAEDPESGFDFGAAIAAVDAQDQVPR